MTELYRLRDIQDWELVQDALTTVYAHDDPVSTIQIMTTVLAICTLSVRNCHTLPAEPSRGAYLADMLHRFDEHLATLRREEMRDAVQDLSPAAIYRLDWVLCRMSAWDIYGFLSMTGIYRDATISTNHIARRLQWLLGCNDWTPPGTVQGFRVRLQLHVEGTQWCLEQDQGIDQKNWDSEGWLECAPDEPESEGDRRADSSQAAGPGPTSEAVDEQDSPESRMDSLKRSITRVIRGVWRKFRGTAAQEPDVEMRAVDTSPSAAPATDAALPDISDAPPMTATTLDESPQGQNADLIGQTQPLEATEPRADDSGAARGVAEHGADADADEGRQGGLVSAAEHADEDQGGDVRPSQEGLTAPYDAPTQLSKSHCEPCSQSQNDG
ncbi:uncharacterized protein B0H18DRAFT_360089 [Fomitopsis serialis]|uniref:uncharacterized protein n=1 Tax=Fomitopsis serialis TaxID=139415 RepID=UPI002007787B|nr:uncharacterized protein B0H18DRAFT_360089 [Neoantrodia serialis]KAH9926015.1 hypothetical protein B0H18DRAFT_360089 [Neoantrodia serialis]